MMPYGLPEYINIVEFDTQVRKDDKLLMKFADFDKIVVKPHNVQACQVRYGDLTYYEVDDKGKYPSEYTCKHSEMNNHKIIFYDCPEEFPLDEIPYKDLKTKAESHQYIRRFSEECDRAYAKIIIDELCVTIREFDEIYIHTQVVNGEKYIAKATLEDLRYLLFEV